MECIIHLGEREVYGYQIIRYEYECIICKDDFEDEADVLTNPTCDYCKRKRENMSPKAIPVPDIQERLFSIGAL